MASLRRIWIGRLSAWLIWLAFLLVPIFAMGNCGGWNEGSMTVANCVVDTPFLRDLADSFYGFALLSAFTLGVPVLIYLVVGYLSGRVIGRIIRGK